MKLTRSHFCCCLLLAVRHVNASTTLYRVENYVNKAQSPFIEGIENGLMTFNDFDTVPIAYPNLTFPKAPRYGGLSIDGDDGVIDGYGLGVGLKATPVGNANFTFNFSADANGHYPRYFGIAFPAQVRALHVPTGFVAQTPAQQEGSFEVIGVKDAFGKAVLTDYVFDSLVYPDGGDPPDSYWGIFFGFYSDDGISQVVLHNAAWLDHLQYGYQIPRTPHGTLRWRSAHLPLGTQKEGGMNSCTEAVGVWSSGVYPLSLVPIICPLASQPLFPMPYWNEPGLTWDDPLFTYQDFAQWYGCPSCCALLTSPSTRNLTMQN